MAEFNTCGVIKITLSERVFPEEPGAHPPFKVLTLETITESSIDVVKFFTHDLTLDIVKKEKK